MSYKKLLTKKMENCYFDMQRTKGKKLENLKGQYDAYMDAKSEFISDINSRIEQYKFVLRACNITEIERLETKAMIALLESML